MLRDWPKTLPATGDTTYGANSSPGRGKDVVTANKPLFHGVVCSFRRKNTMAQLHPKASYVEFVFTKDEHGRLIRALYEKEYPGKLFGNREWKKFTVAYGDREFVFKQTKALGLLAQPINREPDFTVHSVFVESEVTDEEKWLLLSQNSTAVVRMCWICKSPMLSGQHKHMMIYCAACKYETEHSTPFFGFPFTCNVCRR